MPRCRKHVRVLIRMATPFRCPLLATAPATAFEAFLAAVFALLIVPTLAA
jgi:hypothetical protein